MVRESLKGLFLRFRTPLILVSVLIIGLSAVWLWREYYSKSSERALPTAITQQINTFKPYYLRPTYSTDFTLQQNTVKYQYGVLVFNLKNTAGNSLSVTEEATPSQFDPSTLQTTKQFDTEYGQAYITDSPDRTTGTLFTSDKTWIIINAPHPVGGDFMQQFIEALVPAIR